jgi:hypothetical protein
MPKVKRKRSMLVKEGVSFDKLGRVEKHCMYNNMTKKRKIILGKKNNNSDPITTNNNKLLEKEILLLVIKRGTSKTC